MSTTVDEGLLSEARLANPGRNDAALLARARALAIDASYGAYDEHPIDEPDEWGDRSHTQSTYFGYARGMELDTRLLVRDYGMVVNGAGDVPALEAVGDGALTVLNLFALREVAAYEDDRSCSGFEAMLRYSAVSGDRLAAVGGSFIAKALPTGVVWGEDDNWDVLVVAMLPSVRAFWSLLADPTYRKAFAHRRAAISRQRVTVAVPLP